MVIADCAICALLNPACDLLLGVYFILKGEPLENNSVIALSDIEEGDNALICKTNLTNCCGIVPNRFGQFYYPSGFPVPIKGLEKGFYRNRGDQEIRLHRRSGCMSPTGRFCCKIPDSNMVIQNIFIELVIVLACDLRCFVCQVIMSVNVCGFKFRNQVLNFFHLIINDYR